MKRKANREQLEALYEEAIKIKKQKPWKWMSNGQVFAIEDPKTHINYYCMVQSDDHHDAVQMLIGEEGINRLLSGLNALDEEEYGESELSLADYLMSFDELSLNCFFVDKDGLTTEEEKQFEELELTFRGRKQWITLKKMIPGRLLSSIQDEDEITLMTVLLAQVRKVCSMEKQEAVVTDLFNGTIVQDIFHWRYDDQTERWEGSFLKLEDIVKQYQVVMYHNQLDMHKVRRLRNSQRLYELLRIYMPVPVEHHTDLYFPVVFMLMDLDTGEIAWSHMELVSEGYELRFIDQLAQFFLDEGRKPAKIVTADFILHHIVADFCDKSRIFLDFLDYTVVGDEVIENFMEYTKNNMKMTTEMLLDNDLFDEAWIDGDLEQEEAFLREMIEEKRQRHLEREDDEQAPVSNIIDFRTGKPITPSAK